MAMLVFASWQFMAQDTIKEYKARDNLCLVGAVFFHSII